jgi:flagellar basal-body rod protein FlgC
MSFLSSLNIGGSALTAQRFRMDVISQNMANTGTSRTEAGTPYYRKSVVMKERSPSFSDMLSNKNAGMGVEIVQVSEDKGAIKPVYDPTHPDADANGYVNYPDISMVKEMMDMMSASRSYEAGITAVNAVKSMASSALQIGK